MWLTVYCLCEFYRYYSPLMSAGSSFVTFMVSSWKMLFCLEDVWYICRMGYTCRPKFLSVLTFSLQKDNLRMNVVSSIQRRFQTLYTALCNGVVSHGAQIGGLQVFANHTCKNTKQMRSWFTRHAAFYMCLSSCSGCRRCSWHTYLMNHIYFDYGKTRRPPI